MKDSHSRRHGGGRDSALKPAPSRDRFGFDEDDDAHMGDLGCTPVLVIRLPKSTRNTHVIALLRTTCQRTRAYVFGSGFEDGEALVKHWL